VISVTKPGESATPSYGPPQRVRTGSGRAAGPEWVNSFDRFVELLWQHADPTVIAQLEAAFRARGPLWAPIANAFSPEHGARLRARDWRAPGARRPAVVLR